MPDTPTYVRAPFDVVSSHDRAGFEVWMEAGAGRAGGAGDGGCCKGSPCSKSMHMFCNVFMCSKRKPACSLLLKILLSRGRKVIGRHHDDGKCREEYDISLWSAYSRKSPV